MLDTNQIENIYKHWSSDPYFDFKTRAETSFLSPDDITDSFYTELEFGTSGIRGVMGVGINRLNRYTIRKATLGLSVYLKEKYGDKAAQKGVVIAYDSRHNSYDLALETALVLCNEGIKAYLFSEISPTPLLSFAVRHLGAVGGVVITASHNSKEYNGYKTYDEKGCQMASASAKKLSKIIDGISVFEKIYPMPKKDAEEKGLLCMLDDSVLNAFCGKIISFANLIADGAKKDLKVIYTPLHGTGKAPVMTVLKKCGFDVSVVPQQAEPDGDFPTVRIPNPEDRRALELGIKLATELDADIVIGTDPDSDRVGAAVKTDEGFKLISGNQMGALLVDYVISKKNISSNSAIVKTIVTGDLGAVIAAHHGIHVAETLTGFKYIGEQIDILAQKGFNYLMGYEESYGYLLCDHVRDKDGVSAAMFICEMAAQAKSQGKTLWDVLNELYKKYGYFVDEQDSFALKGMDGVRKISQIMEVFRAESISFMPNIDKVIDYSAGIGDLPASNVLKFIFTDGSYFAVRPSGTEPKIKMYYSIRGNDRQDATQKLEQIRSKIKELVCQ